MASNRDGGTASIRALMRVVLFASSGLCGVFILGQTIGCGVGAPVVAGGSGAALATDQGGAPETGKPVPPLKLATPDRPEAVHQGRDLRREEASVLLGEAREAAGNGDYRLAAQLQYWAVETTGTEQYDLACYQVRLGRVNAAFYWLQLAAVEDGVDAAWAEQDPDLEPLRGDARWGKVRDYLRRCSNYWASNGKPLTDLVVPMGYNGREPLTTLVWLTGSFSHPGVDRSGLVQDVQALVDREQIAIIGVSGTVPLGKAKFSWSEDPERDFGRIKAAVQEVAGRVNVKRGSVIALGLSQGAQAGLAVATRHPEFFAGAVAICPGVADEGSALPKGTPAVSLAARVFVVVSGAEDHPVRVELAADDVRWLESAKAKVVAKQYPGLGHGFPPDLETRLGEWIRMISEAAHSPG